MPARNTPQREHPGTSGQHINYQSQVLTQQNNKSSNVMNEFLDGSVRDQQSAK